MTYSNTIAARARPVLKPYLMVMSRIQLSALRWEERFPLPTRVPAHCYFDSARFIFLPCLPVDIGKLPVRLRRERRCRTDARPRVILQAYPVKALLHRGPGRAAESIVGKSG